MKVRLFVKGDDPIMREARELTERLDDPAFDLEIEIIDTETKDGEALCELYEIFSTPTFMVTADDGSVINTWQGTVPGEADVRRYLIL